VVGDEALREQRNARIGGATGGTIGLPLAWMIASPWTSARPVLLHLALDAGAFVFLLGAMAIGGWAAKATGRRLKGGGVLHGVAASAVGLVGFAALAMASDAPAVAEGQKTVGGLLIGGLTVLFFGAVPALIIGFFAGLVMSATVVRPRRTD
jgi:hypothetical protein